MVSLQATPQSHPSQCTISAATMSLALANAYVNMLTHAKSMLLPQCTSAPSLTPLVPHDFAFALIKQRKKI